MRGFTWVRWRPALGRDTPERYDALWQLVPKSTQGPMSGVYWSTVFARALRHGDEFDMAALRGRVLPRPISSMEPAMLGDVLYFFGGLAAFGLVALSVSAAGRL